MKAALVRQVRQRAYHRCEYCHLPQDFGNVAFEIDHVISRKHRGPTVARNLALAGFWCNSHKGTDIGGLDGRKLTPLFNPRRHKWTRHFRWDGPLLRGRTPVGRVTVALLRINDSFRVDLRDLLIQEGVFPPE